MFDHFGRHKSVCHFLSVDQLEMDLSTALFEKVYRTVFQTKRRRLVFKTGVIMYIQDDNYKITQKYFQVYIYIYCHISPAP